MQELPKDALILDFVIPLSKFGDYVKTYKVAPRAQNAHAIVNAAFKLEIFDKKIGAAVLAFGGIGNRAVRAANFDVLQKIT